MSPQQFVYASIVVGVVTLGILLWGLGAVVRRSSRLTALQVLGVTVVGGGVLVVAGWVVGQGSFEP